MYIDTRGILANTLENMDTIFGTKNGLHMVHLNVNSLAGPKLTQIKEMFRNRKVNILSFSETKPDESITDSEIEIENYSAIRNDRNGKGVVYACILIFKSAKPVLVGTIYRPPSQSDFYDILI